MDGNGPSLVCVGDALGLGGQSPEDLSPFLPWQMTPERREELARPVLLTPLPVASASQELGAPVAADTS